MRTLSLLFLSLVALAAPADAQRASLRGTVTDAGTDTALPGANVVVTRDDGQRVGRATDRDGQFAFSGLLPGRYVVRVTSLGYAPFADTLALAFGEAVTFDVGLSEEEQAMESVTVESEGSPPTAAPAGVVRIRPADLATIPSPDVGADLAGFLTVQPGITSIGDRGGQLYVRGGTPTQNLVLVDGMRVFQPFHIVGFYSAFPAEIIQTADVYAGGFGARYGGRISSVIDVQTRNGNKQRFEGAAAVAPFLTSVRVEGPIVPGEASFVASVRESVVERIAEPLLGEELPYRFGDAFGKIHFFTGPASYVTFTGLRTTDEGNVSGTADDRTRIGWTNETAGARFFYLPPSVAASALDITVNYSAYRSTFDPERGPGRRADATSFGGQFAYAYFLDNGAEFHLGFAGQTFLFDYTFDDAERATSDNTTEGNAHFEAAFDLGRLRLEPGLRLQLFPSQARNASVEPRLRAAYRLSDATTLSAAFGVYRQEIIGLSDERDIGDVFLAWASIPAGEPTPRALHAIAGVETRIAGVTLSAEGYAKQLDAMQVLLGDRGLVRSNGEVFGLDLRAEGRRGPFYGLASYGLSAADYRNARESYRPPHDRRHRLNLVGEFSRGPWRLAARWQLASGRPFTRLVGLYDVLGAPSPSGTFITEAGTPTVVLEDEPFRGLTPAYYRLDLSIERDVRVGGALLTVQASLINATDRANFFYYDAFRADRVDQFPLIPSLGLRVAFD